MISVVVPVYNVEKYLEKCINSICEQTYKDLEIILVDDGSTDRSGEICEEFAQKDQRISVIHQKNAGLSVARNTGIAAAKGELIAFVDSDDYIHPQMYEVLLHHMEKYDADISVGNFIMVYENSTKSIGHNGVVEVSNVNSFKVTGIEALEFLYSERCVQTVVAWNKLYKHKLFNNIRYPNGRLHEDEFTTHKLLYESESVVYVDMPVYYYLQREGSIMRKGSAKRYGDRLEGYKEQVEFLEGKGLAKLAVSARACWVYYMVNQYILARKQKCVKEVYTKKIWNTYDEYQTVLSEIKQYSIYQKFLIAIYKRFPTLYCGILMPLKANLDRFRGR